MKAANAPSTTSVPTADPSASRTRSGSLDHRDARSAIRDPVSGAADGLDRGAIERPIDLRAHVADMDVDDVGVVIERPVPDVLDQVRSADHLATVPHQVREDLELLRRQLDRMVAPAH